MKTYMLSIILLLIIATACDEHSNSPAGDDSIPPQLVSNPVVENYHGAAKISFQLPIDDDFLYVKARYTVLGETMEARSSAYINYIELDGFASTDPVTVNLFSVDRNENESASLSVTVNPLTPPISEVLNSIQYEPDFGGVNLKFMNENQANIVVIVLTKNGLDEWNQADAIYTKMKDVNYSVRGMDAVETHFGLYVRDRWYHMTDTMEFTLTPIYEEEIDKSTFKDKRYSSEPANYSSSYKIEQLWDNDLSKMFHTKQNVGLPLSFTFDLGKVVKLSRMKTWQRNGSYLYNHGNPKIWEVWGCTTLPSGDGWEGWTKLMDCESIKPSGAPFGTVTTEDQAYAEAGEEFTFPNGTPAIRFMRWRVRESWSAGEENPGGFFHLREMTLWGSQE